MLADEVCLLLVVISLAMRGVNGHGNFEELLGSMAETRSEPLPRTPHRGPRKRERRRCDERGMKRRKQRHAARVSIGAVLFGMGRSFLEQAHVSKGVVPGPTQQEHGLERRRGGCLRGAPSRLQTRVR